MLLSLLVFELGTRLRAGGCVYELFAVLLMARPCRSMRAHAARRPNVFVLGAKPLLQERLPRQASGGPGRPTLDASAAASDASENWASGINLGMAVRAAVLSWSTLWARSRALGARGIVVVTRLLQIRRCPIGAPR